MIPPLYITVDGVPPNVTASLATCRNCGQVKVYSDPCGFDHLAAILQLRARVSEIEAATA